MKTDDFAIKLGNRVPADSPAPADPLQEFSDLEMRLLRYCHLGNRTFWFEINGVAIDLDGRSWTLTLDPDLSFVLRDLPTEVAAFLRGEPLHLTFGERCLSVQFVPAGDVVEFTAAAFGPRLATRAWILQKTDCATQWLQFLNVIASDMIALGFLSTEQADVFLADLGGRNVLEQANHGAVLR